MTKPYPKLVTQALCLDPSEALAWLQARTPDLADPDRVEAMICAKRVGRATSKVQIEDALTAYRGRPATIPYPTMLEALSRIERT